MAGNASHSTPAPEPNRPRRTQRQRREETRRKLVRAAIDILNERGGAKFTTAAVAEKAGLTRGAIQYHFDTPKDLLCAAVVQIADDLNPGFHADRLQKLPVGERIDKIVEAFWRGFKSTSYAAILELAIQGRHDPELNRTIKAALQDLDDDRAKVWLAAFSDTGCRRADLLTWRASLLVALRGLALTRMIRGDEAVSKAQVDEFKAYFRQRLINA